MDSGEFRGFAGRAGSLAAGRAAVCNFSHIHKTSDRTDLPACHNGALRLAQMEVSRRAGAPPAAAADRSYRSHRFPSQPHPLYGCGKMALRPAAGVGGSSAKPKLGARIRQPCSRRAQQLGAAEPHRSGRTHTVLRGRLGQGCAHSSADDCLLQRRNDPHSIPPIHPTPQRGTNDATKHQGLCGLGRNTRGRL